MTMSRPLTSRPEDGRSGSASGGKNVGQLAVAAAPNTIAPLSVLPDGDRACASLAMPGSGESTRVHPLGTSTAIEADSTRRLPGAAASSSPPELLPTRKPTAASAATSRRPARIQTRPRRGGAARRSAGTARGGGGAGRGGGAAAASARVGAPAPAGGGARSPPRRGHR